MTHAKFNFNQLMLTLIFGIRASESPLGPGERLKTPGLIGLTYEIGAEDVYKDFWYDKGKFDNSDYPENSSYHDKTNRKVIGKFKMKQPAFPYSSSLVLSPNVYLHQE